MAVTGIGAVTPIGTGAEGCGPACSPTASAVRADRPLRRHRRSRRGSPRRSTTSTRPGPSRRASARDGSTASASSAWPPPAWRSSTPSLTDADRAADADRRLDRLGARRRRLRRGAARRLRARAASRAVVADAGHSPSSAGPAPATWRSTSASAGRRSATRTRAPPGRWPSGRPSTPSAPASWTLALAGGAEAPLAPLTFGAFAMIRVLSSRNDDPATASRPVRPSTATAS